MAALPEQNDCVHRGICKFRGDGMCLTECGHYAVEEKVTSANSAMVPCPTCGAACSIGGDDEEETHYFIPVVPFRAQGQ